jgi:hypothetical protein
MAYDYLTLVLHREIDDFTTQFIQLSDSTNYGLSGVIDEVGLNCAIKIRCMITNLLSKITTTDEYGGARNKLLPLFSKYNNLINSIQPKVCPFSQSCECGNIK